MSLLLCALLFQTASYAADKPLPAAPSTYVYDEKGVLKPKTVQILNTVLGAENQKSGNQVVLVIFKELGSEDLVAWTNRIFKAWGIGKKGKDNGVLLALYWKERKIRIEVGYGLEGLLTDARSKRILAEHLIPALRANQPDEGMVFSTREILTAIQSPLIQAGELDRLLAGGGFQLQTHPVALVEYGIWGLAALLFLFPLGGFLWVLFHRRQWQSTKRGSRGPWDGGGGWGGGGISSGSSDWGSSSGGSDSGGGFSGGGGSSGGGGASGEW